MTDAVKRSQEAKESGNASFKKGRFVEAIGHYTTSHLLNPSDPSPLLNRAQAYLKLEKWQDCERDCTTVIYTEGQDRNVKAFYRRALARKELGDLSGARADLASILSMDPGNQAARDEISELAKVKPPSKDANRRAHIWPPARPTTEKVDQPAASTSEQGSSEPDTLMKEVSTRRSRAPPEASTSTTAAAPSGHTSTSFADRKANRDQARQSFARPAPASRPAPANVGGGTNEAMDVDEPALPPKRGANELQESPRRPAPATGLEFLTALDECHEDNGACWSLIQSLPPSQLATLVAPLIEPDHLAAIFAALRSAISNNPQQRSLVREYLTALQAMKRYGVTLMMLSGKERGIAAALEKELP